MSNCLNVDHMDNGTVQLTLNRPQQRNALNGELVTELREALRELSKKQHVRLLVVTGAGDAFCTGADLNWVQEKQNRISEPGRDPGTQISECLAMLDNFPCPVIARVNGPAFGVGAGLLACCDIAISVKSAKFAFTEVRIGLVPAVSAPYIMTNIGARQARRWLLSGETMDSTIAERIGLIHLAVDDSQLDQSVEQQKSFLLLGAPGAQQESKHWLKQLTINGHHESAAFHRAAGIIFRRCLYSTEAKEGVQARIQESDPNWVVK